MITASAAGASTRRSIRAAMAGTGTLEYFIVAGGENWLDKTKLKFLWIILVFIGDLVGSSVVQENCDNHANFF